MTKEPRANWFMALSYFHITNTMIQLPPYAVHQPIEQPRNELDDILPLITSRAQPKLIRQLQMHGLTGEELQTDCYKLYDQYGIDPLLEVHPLRESFFQMELSKGQFQLPHQETQPSPTTQQPNMLPSPKQDCISISKDHLLIFMAITLLLLLILQVLPKN